MVLKMSTIAIMLLASFTVLGLRLFSLDKTKEPEKFEKQAQIEAQSDEKGANKPIFEDTIDKATSAADGAEADSAGAPDVALESAVAFAQEAASQVASPAFNFTVRKQSAVVSNVTISQAVRPAEIVANEPTGKTHEEQSVKAPPRTFSKILGHIKNASGYAQYPILKAACDSFAFSCEEIIQFANITIASFTGGPPHEWEEAGNAIWLFARGRENKGCISDPANAQSIINLYLSIWPASMNLPALTTALIDNEDLEPATMVGPQPMQLQTGSRTDEDMEKVLRDMKELQLIKANGPPRAWHAWVKYEPGSPPQKEFESWLKQIRSNGEQFSGSQLVSLAHAMPALVTLVRAVPANSQTAQRHHRDEVWRPLRDLLYHLARYVTGVTCDEVKQIIHWMDGGVNSRPSSTGFLAEDLQPLTSIIVDGQNKVDIVAFAGLLKVAGRGTEYVIAEETETVLRDVGVGLPPKNNPVFGVVKGNPVIFVVDESTSMDTNLTLGDDTFTRRKFCNIQLEAVLEGLPNGTDFNVVQYSSTAVKIFQKPVPVNKTNIHTAMEAMGIRWTGNYTPEQDPLEMLHNIKVFALKDKHKLDQRSGRNSMQALQLAYAIANNISLTWTDNYSPGQNPLEMMKQIKAFALLSPQIYFLTSGEPDGGASLILDKIDELHKKGKRIPVNSIAFITPADLAAKQFVRDVAQKTGGFLRSIEQASLQPDKTKQEPSDTSSIPPESDLQEPTESDRSQKQLGM